MRADEEFISNIMIAQTGNNWQSRVVDVDKGSAEIFEPLTGISCLAANWPYSVLQPSPIHAAVTCRA